MDLLAQVLHQGVPTRLEHRINCVRQSQRVQVPP
jgi:hypothetical protein